MSTQARTRHLPIGFGHGGGGPQGPSQLGIQGALRQPIGPKIHAGSRTSLLPPLRAMQTRELLELRQGLEDPAGVF